jgi:hypothetical protein
MDVNEARIREMIFCRNGLRKSFGLRDANRAAKEDRELGHQAYFVWRLARFHGGADVTLPMLAYLMLHGGAKEELEELEALAGQVAKETFGTDIGAAMKWDRVLGHRA